MKKLFYTLMAFVIVISLTLIAHLSPASAQDSGPQPKNMVVLGEAIFFDTDLSVNGTQSCASCHAPETGYSGPDSQVNLATAVYPGAIETRFGNRRPPTAAYAGFSPELHYDAALGKWAGGMFWDGRASGAQLHDPLAEQAQGPFLNPLEQALPNAKQVAVRVAHSEYAGLFVEVWGPGSLDYKNDLDGVFERIARSLAAYERSSEVGPYTSKFDLFWDNAQVAGLDVTKINCGSGNSMGACGMGGGGGDMGGGGGMGGGGNGGGGMGGGGNGGGGMGGGGNANPNSWQAYRNLGLSDVELQGLAAFNDPNRANCASCHSLEPGADGYPLFTNFAYDNLGIPKNPDNPFYSMPRKWNPDGANWIDYGLGGYLQSAGYGTDVYNAELGKFKTPGLRNVDMRPSADFVKAYGHNGYFKSLDEIILFYAWRGLTMNGGLGLGGSGMDCGMMDGGGMGGGGMGGGNMAMMCDPNLFPQPEVNQNLTPMNHFNMMDQATIPVFLATLTDGYMSPVPAAPSDLVATAISLSQVDLTWTDNATDETGFWIERAPVIDDIPGTFAYIGMANMDATSFSDVSAVANTTYAYRIFAINLHGESQPSNIATVTTPDIPPADPVNLVATFQASLETGPRVRLVFRDNATDETGFVVERSDNEGVFVAIETLPPKANRGNVTYVDTSVLADQTYVYRVFAVKGITSSAYSNIATVNVPPAPEAPSNFVATTMLTNGWSSVSITLTWTDNSINESRFVVQRATDPEFTTGLVSFNAGANKTTLAQTRLPRGMTYYYRIMAQNPYGSSAWVSLVVTTP